MANFLFAEGLREHRKQCNDTVSRLRGVLESQQLTDVERDNLTARMHEWQERRDACNRLLQPMPLMQWNGKPV